MENDKLGIFNHPLVRQKALSVARSGQGNLMKFNLLRNYLENEHTVQGWLTPHYMKANSKIFQMEELKQ